ncbi:YdcF family protein [Vibrio mytili]|uniref:DUF218 domain-containing protein n=1 Tax=Vibrio mytili TaxID=50718 RepID=A0A0C3DFE1_9VIBR|nr:YdcF family protein [Vibrio mytili]KIN10084.1 hypothetical protein SU60_15620 [Vibrio mytili]
MAFEHVVIVLGKRLINNRLSPEGISRVNALAEALGELSVENTIIVFCGGITQDQDISEADAMYHQFKAVNASSSNSFPDAQVLLENRSVNTVQNMQYAAEVLCRSGLFPLFSPENTPIDVILLSNDYHLQRIIEIQSLMNEQGLLRVLEESSASMGLTLNIPVNMKKHISVPYPHQHPLATSFLLLDELTTYRVYLEGVINGAFKRRLSEVRAEPLSIARKAIEQLKTLSLSPEILGKIEEMKKAIELTAFDESVTVAKASLEILHPILTGLNRRLDPESNGSR